MENVIFNNEKEFTKFLKNARFLGAGEQGSCYLYKGKWTLKIFNDRYLQYLQDSKSINDLLLYQDVNIDGFSFVKCLVYVGNQLVGLLAPFILGKDIERSPLAYKPVSDVIIASSSLVPSIEELTDLNIEAWDVGTKNIIYHKCRLTVIDTVNFRNFTRKSSILKINFENTMTPIINSSLGLREPLAITDPLRDTILIKQFLEKTNSRYKDYDRDFSLLENPRELLLGIKGELEGYLEHKIERFSDARKPLKRKLIK